MVFPLGMYAVATHGIVDETGWPALITVSLVVCWVAMLTWLGVTAGGLAAAARSLTVQRTGGQHG